MPAAACGSTCSTFQRAGHAQGLLTEQHWGWSLQPQGNTWSLWKYFGISLCLISLCTVYTFNGQGIIRGALWCGVFLQRALPSANGCGLKWAQALNAQHKHWKSSVIQGTSEKLIAGSVGKPNPWQCQMCLGFLTPYSEAFRGCCERNQETRLKRPTEQLGKEVVVYSAASKWKRFHVLPAFVIQLWISARLQSSSVTGNF